jgi:hypothetical protein
MIQHWDDSQDHQKQSETAAVRGAGGQESTGRFRSLRVIGRMADDARGRVKCNLPRCLRIDSYDCALLQIQDEARQDNGCFVREPSRCSTLW